MSEDLRKKITNYTRRWNIETDELQSFTQLRNRLLFVLEEVLKTYTTNLSFQNRYAYWIGAPAPFSITGTYALMNQDGNLQAKGFRASQMYDLIQKTKSLQQLIWYLQNIFFVLEEGRFSDPNKRRIEKIDELAQRVREVIDSVPNIQIRLIKRNNSVILTPKGAKILDDKLVNDVLDWLDEFPDVKKHYQDALLLLTDKGLLNIRNVFDNLRLSLELLLKQILGNKEHLEDQGKYLKVWLGQRGVEKHINMMFTELISRDRYTEMMNDVVKHGDRIWLGAEAEFVVYQTGIFIRFICEVSKLPLVGSSN